MGLRYPKISEARKSPAIAKSHAPLADAKSAWSHWPTPARNTVTRISRTCRIAAERAIMSEPLYDQVVLSTSDSTTSRVMLGESVSNLNAGVTTAQQGLLLPASTETTLPAITAEVRYKGVPLSPQPTVLWELSCGANVATIDQSGVITRRTNSNAFSYDSNGGVSTGQIGSLIQVSATVLRADGSQSGVRGVLDVTIQAQAARQFAATTRYDPAARNAPSSTGFYNLID
jgi:hypothetical protein